MNSEFDRLDFEAGCQILFAMFRADPAKPLRSSSAFFTGRRRAKDGRFNQEIKACSSNESRLHTATATRNTSRSVPPIWEGYRGGKFYAVLASLSDRHIVIIRALHMPQCTQQHEFIERANVLLQREYYATFDKSLRTSTRHAIAQMVQARLESIRTPTLALAMTIKTWEYFDVLPDAWHKNYSVHWKALGELLDCLHKEAVLAFYRREVVREVGAL